MTPAELRAAREAVGWTRQQAGERAGLSKESVRDYELGRRPPAAAYAAYIAAVAAAVRGVPSPAARTRSASNNS